MTDEPNEAMSLVKLTELFEKSVESWDDSEIREMSRFLRTASAKYEIELDVRAAKKKAKKEKNTSVSLTDILEDSLDS